MYLRLVIVIASSSLQKDQHMPASQRIAVVDSAVNAVVVPCRGKQPAQISHYPPTCQ